MPVKIQAPVPCRQDKDISHIGRGDLFRFPNTFMKVPIVYMMLEPIGTYYDGDLQIQYTPINSEEKSGKIFTQYASKGRRVIPVIVKATSEDKYS